MIPSSTNLVEYRFNKDQKPRSPLEPKKFYQKKKKKKRKKERKKKLRCWRPIHLEFRIALQRKAKRRLYSSLHIHYPSLHSPSYLPAAPESVFSCGTQTQTHKGTRKQQGHVAFPLSFSSPPLAFYGDLPQQFSYVFIHLGAALCFLFFRD